MLPRMLCAALVKNDDLPILVGFLEPVPLDDVGDQFDHGAARPALQHDQRIGLRVIARGEETDDA